MHTLPWNSLAAAATDAEVVTVVRDYLSQWSPRELAILPASCRPGRIRDAEDIADCAYELTRSRIAARGDEALLVELETFFAHACKRLSAIDGPTRNGDATQASEGSNES